MGQTPGMFQSARQAVRTAMWGAVCLAAVVFIAYGALCTVQEIIEAVLP